MLCSQMMMVVVTLVFRSLSLSLGSARGPHDASTLAGQRKLSCTVVRMWYSTCIQYKKWREDMKKKTYEDKTMHAIRIANRIHEK